MVNFQKLVLIIAIIILILSLVFIGITLKNAKYDTWPPVTASCPDYWVDESKGDKSGSRCVNVKNLGTCKSNKVMNFNTNVFTGSNEMCAKYNWANNCKVSWDGITYGVQNPCEDDDNDD
jgi:hypothetical protein